MTLSRNPVVRFASTVVLLAGLWFAVSPWIYGNSSPPTAFNNWMVGGMITTFAFMRLMEPESEFASWVNVLLGVWVIGSPWIQSYVRVEPRLLNTLIVGVVVFLMALISAKARTRRFEM